MGLDLLRAMRRFRANPLEALQRLSQTYGDLVGFRIGPKWVYLVSHPDYVARVFQNAGKQYTRDTYMNSLARRLLGENGLSANDGERWVAQRRMLQPIFKPRNMASYASVMRDEASAVLERWEVASSAGTPVDAAQATGELSLRIACRALFGVALDEELERVVHHEFLLLNADLTRRLTSLLPLPPVLPTSRDRRWRSALARLNGTVQRVIADRRRSGVESDDLLGLLLAARDEVSGARMGDEEVRDHVKTFMLGGYETTAHALSWSLYLLAGHPAVASKLEAEVDAALGGRLPEPPDLEQVPYARAVFEEAMRLYPPGWVTARSAVLDDEVGGYQIRRGSDILLSPYVMHRHPRYWDEPEVFRPERFLEPPAARARFVYFPFGGGPQACIGKAFAMLQGQLVLAMFAQRFRASLVKSHVVQPEALLTLRAREGVRIVLESRDRSRAVPGAKVNVRGCEVLQ